VIRKYADQHAKEKVNELKRLNPNRQISKVEETAMQDRADDFFGWKSAARLKPGLDSVRTDSTASPTSASPSDPPVDPLPPAGAPAPNCSSRGEEALINEQPMRNEVPTVATTASLATTSGPQSESETQNSKIPQSQSAEVAGATPAGTPHPESTPESQQSQIEIQNSKIETPMLCPQCQHILPPLMPDGQHPWPGCWFCGIRLLPPAPNSAQLPAAAAFLDFGWSAPISRLSPLRRTCPALAEARQRGWVGPQLLGIWSKASIKIQNFKFQNCFCYQSKIENQKSKIQMSLSTHRLSRSHDNSNQLVGFVQQLFQSAAGISPLSISNSIQKADSSASSSAIPSLLANSALERARHAAR